MTRLEQIEARAMAATNGWPSNEAPNLLAEFTWLFGGQSICATGNYEEIVCGEEGTPWGVRYPEDGEFMAQARADIPWLLDRVRELEEAIKQMAAKMVVDSTCRKSTEWANELSESLRNLEAE